MSLSELYDELTDGGKSDVEDHLTQIRTAFRFWTVFFLIAALTPIIAVFFNPSGENLEAWFQRAGSITVVFGLFAEVRVSRIKLLSSADSIPFLYGPIYLKRKYASKANWAGRVSFLVVIIGTVIWGYGDLLCSLL
jgi:hypothetical protein